MYDLSEGLYGLMLIKAATGRFVETPWLMAPKKLFNS